MLELSIPSYRNLQIKYVVCDYNGTLAVEGLLPKQTKAKLLQLSRIVHVMVLTADTYGTVSSHLKNTAMQVQIIPAENGQHAKAAVIRKLGPSACMAIGNGNNDAKMLKLAALGVCILGPEGCSKLALDASDIVFASINDCLDALLSPKRLVATLRC